MPPSLHEPEWRHDPKPVAYAEAIRHMDARAPGIREGTARELVWFLEHPPLYTAGSSARAGDLLDPDRLPVHASGRGGRHTYHGPGQRVVYVLLDLQRRGLDARSYVRALERWLIDSLAGLGIHGERREGRVGVWIARTDGTESKIAAIGVRIRRHVSLHGVSLNVCPDLSHYDGIIPCGLPDHGVTSLQQLGCHATPGEVDRVLASHFRRVFLPGTCDGARQVPPPPP